MIPDPTPADPNPSSHPVRKTRFSRKRIALAIVLVAALGGLFYLSRHLGLFAASPETVLTRAFELANEGNYEAATEYIAPGPREGLLSKPEEMKELWDFFTLDRNFKELAVTKEEASERGLKYLKLKIFFKNKKLVETSTLVGLEDGAWRFSIRDIERDMMTKFRAFRLLKLFPFELPEKAIQAPATAVSLRVPPICEFNAKTGEFEHRMLGVNIHVEQSATPFPSLLEFAKLAIQKRGADSLRSDNLSDARWKKVLLTAKEPRPARIPRFPYRKDLDEIPVNWIFMMLVIGDDREGAIISARCPDAEGILEVTKQSVLSAILER